MNKYNEKSTIVFNSTLSLLSNNTKTVEDNLSLYNTQQNLLRIH